MNENTIFKVLWLAVTIVLTSCGAKKNGDQTDSPVDSTQLTGLSDDERMEWWREAKFGMFIHWGVYSVPAGIYKDKEIDGIGEWIMDKAHIPIPEYEEYARQFNPVKYNAEEWVEIAKNAGMKYIIITSKHHDGFALWDSKVSGYDLVDFSPYRKDALKPLAEACAKNGIKLGFYHSIMDWHHPGAQAESWNKYREEYLKPQLKELLTNYGDISVLWFDGEWIDEWTEDQGKDLYNYVRSLKPDILINNRVGKGRQGMQGMSKDKTYAGDFGTPEQEILEGTSDMDWESCMTMNDTWGYKKNDHNWKSSEALIHNLIDIVAKGGNYLLNVGPTSEGLIPEASAQRLRDIGEWMAINQEAIYGTDALKKYFQGDDIRYSHKKGTSIYYAFLLRRPEETILLQNVAPKEGAEISFLAENPIPLDWNYQEGRGIEIIVPKEVRNAATKAWVFKIMEGSER